MTDATDTEPEGDAPKMTAEEFGAIAMESDTLTRTVLDACLKGHPDGEDALVAGAIMALVRFGIERQQVARPLALITERDVFGYFARYIQNAAATLIRRPDKAN